jgi:tetratricopeptide (TPR) repeat protein
MSDLALLNQKAIQAAIHGQWETAVNTNLEILKLEPKDINARLRLAKAYTYLNKISLAKKYYREVLKEDKYNPIAKRNLVRLKNFKNGNLAKNFWTPTALFLEEPGKTKSVWLVRVTDEKKLANLEVGEPVELMINPNSISVTKNGRYLGRLPDDLAFRLIKLCRTGNKYEAYIRLVDKEKLQIFIREVKRSKRNLQIPSFPQKNLNDEYQTFLPVEILPEKNSQLEEVEEIEEDSFEE